MLRTNRTLASSLALFLLAGAMAPVATNASSMSKKDHTNSSTVQGVSIAVQVYNRGTTAQDIKMGGQTYTVQPHQSITLKGAPGADVFADTAGNGYQKGERLFRFATSINGATIKIN